MSSTLKYNIISKKFLNIISSIKLFVENEIKINTKAFVYKSNIFIEDLLLYRFNYLEKGFSFARVLGKINDDKIKENIKVIKLNAIATKDNQVTSLIYKNLYNYLFNEFDKIFKFNNKIIIIDGTYSNTNIKHNGDVETSMSLIFYDPNNNLTLDANFTGGDKKNNEKIKLQEYISNNIEQFKNKTIIADRAYHCYDFFKFLNENNIKFIIRMKDKDAKNKNKSFENIKKDVNVYKHYCDNIKTVYNKDKKKSSNRKNRNC